jgi:hypothetical protein
MMTKPDGNKILAALQAGETINVDISPDQTPALGIADYGRGVADTFFPVYVSQPGLYPMRLVWFEGGGGANVEWYSFDGAGNRALINDRSNPTAIKTYRARTFTPVTPTIGIRVDGANAVLTFTGVLQAANKVDGAFGDVVATSPHSVPLTGAPMKFWRSRRP